MYLTWWSLILQIVFFTLAAGMVLRSNKYAERPSDVHARGASPADVARIEDHELVRPGFFAGLTWVLQDITYTTALCVVVLFWLQSIKTQPEIDAFDYNIHAGNGVVVLIDSLFSFSPVRLLHWWMPQLLGLCYAIWSIIHYAVGIRMPSGNRYIYSILDWSEWRTALPVTVVAILVVIPLVHTLLFWWHRLGVAIFRCNRPGKAREHPISASTTSNNGPPYHDVEAATRAHHNHDDTYNNNRSAVPQDAYSSNKNKTQETKGAALAW